MLAAAACASALTGGTALASSQQGEGEASVPPIFAPLDQAPADLSVWMRLRDATGWLEEGDSRALALAVVRSLGPDRPGMRLAGLAERLGLAPHEAFDRYFGRDARLFIRRGVPRADWAVLTRVDPADFDRLVSRLRPAMKAGRRYEMPEDGLVFAERDGWVVVADNADGGLYRDLAERFTAPAPAGLDAVARRVGMQGLPDAGMAMVLNGSGALEGSLLITLDSRDHAFRARMRGEFAKPPFPAAEQSRLDVSLLAHLGDDVLAASLDPIRPRVSTEDAFLVASFPEIVPPAAFRANLGSERLILLGEIDGGTLTPPLRMRCPALAVAYAVDDAEQAKEDQDHLMKAVVRGFNRRTLAGQVGENKEPLDPCTTIGKDGMRSIEVSPLLRHLAGDHPLLRGCSLNWEVVRSEAGAWQVYASHPAWLSAVRAELERLPPPVPEAERCSAASAGRACGQRLAGHLRSWNNEAECFAGDGAGGFTRGIEMLAEFAERFRTVSWRIGRPSETSLAIEIDAELAPPNSSEPRP